MKKDNMRKSIIQILTSLRDDKPAGLLGEIAGISESDIAAKYRTKYVNELIGCLIRADMVNGETTSTKGDGSGKPTSFTNLEITLSGFLLLQRLQDEEEKASLLYKSKQVCLYLLTTLITIVVGIVIGVATPHFTPNSREDSTCKTPPPNLSQQGKDTRP